MAKILDMPKLSPTMEEGSSARWHKKEGDAVDVDDLLAEVETDKATMEFRSFDKGTLLKILVARRAAMVKLGQPVAILGAPGEDVCALVAQAGAAAAALAPAAAPAPAAGCRARAARRRPPPRAPPRRARARRRPGSAPRRARRGRPRQAPRPYVRKLARERELDLAGVHGSGPHGRIVARDLERAPSAAPRRTAPRRARARRPASSPRPRSARSRMMRKTIARRLTESKQTVPHFYLTIDVDADPLVALREQHQRRSRGRRRATGEDADEGLASTISS